MFLLLVFLLFVFVLQDCHAGFLQPEGHSFGKADLLVMFSCVLSLPKRHPGSVVVLGCFDS